MSLSESSAITSGSGVLLSGSIARSLPLLEVGGGVIGEKKFET